MEVNVFVKQALSFRTVALFLSVRKTLMEEIKVVYSSIGIFYQTPGDVGFDWSRPGAKDTQARQQKLKGVC